MSPVIGIYMSSTQGALHATIPMEKNATTDVVAVVAILAIVTFAVAWIINYPKDSGTPAVADEPENEVIESMKKFDKQQFEQSLKLSP